MSAYGLEGSSDSLGERVPIPRSSTTAPPPPSVVDPESGDWLRRLRGDGDVHEDALARLHALLLRAAQFEVERRRETLPHLPGGELEAIASEAADDALTCALGRLRDFRGVSCFTTWAAKFALREAAVKLRRRAWQDRELLLIEADADLELDELPPWLRQSFAEALTPLERRVLVALALDGVPIDVLAERLSTTRAALYETLRNARRTLRRRLAASA